MSIATELELLADTKEDLRVSLGLDKSVPFSQYTSYIRSWDPLELFRNGEKGAWFDTNEMTTLFQNSAGATSVTAAGDPVGHVGDKSWRGNYATQTTSAYRPTYTLDPSGVPVLVGDGVDDALLTPPTTYSGSAYISTSYGWYKSFVTEGAIGLPLTWLKEYVAREGVASVADDDKLRNYFATEQKLFIGMASNLVIPRLSMFSGGSNTKVTAIGNNGVTTEKMFSVAYPPVSWDLSADGLTAPALLVFDSNPALTYFDCRQNQLTGSIPDISNTSIVEFNISQNQLTGSIPDLRSHTSLVYYQVNHNKLTGSIPDISSNSLLLMFDCASNQLTGSIPDISSNTKLSSYSVGINQLTGSIPDLSSNVELREFSCSLNKLTGSIPDLSSNTKLTLFHCFTNKLTGWDGGSVSNTLGNFRAEDNALTQSAVDGLLVAFDVAGRATGTLILNGGTNSTPSATGKAAADNLRARGWSVTLNGY